MTQNRQMSLFREMETENYPETDGEMMNFEIERECFKHLKENLSSEAKTEYETGVKHLVERYNTAIYENRFTVGGVVEVFTLALMRSTGIEIEGCGSDETSNGNGGLQYESQRRCRPTTNERA